MSLLGILTIIFVLLKAFSVIDWSWWVVFIPSYLIVLIVVVQLLIFLIIGRKAKKEFDRFTF